MSSSQSKALPESLEASIMEIFEAIVDGFYLFTIVAKISILNVLADVCYAWVTVNTAQNKKFSIKDFFSKCDHTCSFSADLVTFTEEILNGKLDFSVQWKSNALIITTSFLTIKKRCLDITYKFNSNNRYKQ